MKKLLAILMAAVMVISFAACGKEQEEEVPTTEPMVTNADDVINEEDLQEADTTAEAVTDASGEEVTEVVTDASGEAVTDASGEAVTEKVTQKPTTTKKDEAKPVSEWTKQEILNYYNAAVKAADEAPANQKLQGQAVMKLKPGTGITADGGLGGVLKVVSPIVASALERNSNPTSNVPGYGEIKLSDLKSISATENGGKIVVKMTVKEQTDGPAADGSQGTVGRAIGTLGNIQGALDELGAEFSRGRETVTLTYTDVTINATLDKNTGKIVGGTYHYVVNILVKDAALSISIVTANVKNLKAYVDYTVTF